MFLTSSWKTKGMSVFKLVFNPSKTTVISTWHWVDLTSQTVRVIINTVIVDGAFGPWQPWSECSEPCGIGIQTQLRLCDSPPPQNGGSECDWTLAAQMQFCNGNMCIPGEWTTDCMDERYFVLRIIDIAWLTFSVVDFCCSHMQLTAGGVHGRTGEVAVTAAVTGNSWECASVSIQSQQMGAWTVWEWTPRQRAVFSRNALISHVCQWITILKSESQRIHLYLCNFYVKFGQTLRTPVLSHHSHLAKFLLHYAISSNFNVKIS